MANYGNGSNTREAIVQACAELFYEKGFHETSFSDICARAHVNRGTIYYHFPSKDALRYEVQWEYMIRNKHIAEHYCPDSRYHYILAMCMLWHQIHRDPKMLRFLLSCCIDCPVYTGKKDMSHFYFTAYEAMWGQFWEKKNIPELTFASIYGYIMSCLRMLCEAPEKFDPMILYEHCVETSLQAWRVPPELAESIALQTADYFSQIPPEEITVVFP